MKPSALILGAVAAMLAAGCGDASRESERKPPTKITNRHHQELAALPPDLQRLGLMRAIRDNGMRCKRVEAAAYQQDYRQLAMWVALCSDGRHWAIYVAPNGDTQVRPCDQARQLDLPQCRPVAGPGAWTATGKDGG